MADHPASWDGLQPVELADCFCTPVITIPFSAAASASTTESFSDPQFLSVYNTASPAPIHHPHHVPFDFAHSSPQLQARQLLRRIGWAYYTIWEEASPAYDPSREPSLQPVTRLAWSCGDVNRLLHGSEQAVKSRAYNMGRLLQEFYQKCSFLPLRMGVAGQAAARKQQQCAKGSDLLQQIRALSRLHNQPAPSGLRAEDFQTIVAVPLRKGARVLEIGIAEPVPYSDIVMLTRVLMEFIDGPAILRDPGAWPASTSSQPFTISQYDVRGKAHECRSTNLLGPASSNAMQNYGSRAPRQQSLSSSYHSSSSRTSSSLSPEQAPDANGRLTPSPAQNSLNSDEQMLHLSCDSASNINTLLQAAPPPNIQVSSFCQLGIVDQIHDTVTYGNVSTGVSAAGVSNHNMHSTHSELPLSHFNDNEFCLSDHHGISPAFSSPDVQLSLHEFPPQEHTTPLHQHQISTDGVLGFTMQSLQRTDYNPLNPFLQIYNGHEHGFSSSISGAHDPSVIRGKSQHAAARIAVEVNHSNSNRIDIILQRSIQNSNPSTGMLDQGIIRYPNHTLPNQNSIIAGGQSDHAALVDASANMSRAQHGDRETATHEAARRELATSSSADTPACQQARYLTTAGDCLGSSDNSTHHDHRRQQQQQQQHNFNAFNSSEVAAMNHTIAERNRRRKHGECIAKLRALVPNISKRDKVTTLERAIEYIEELQGIINKDPQQQWNSLKHDEGDPHNVEKAPETAVPTHSTCKFRRSSGAFELTSNLSIEDHSRVNTSIIEIVRALQKKNLHCTDFNLKFQPNSNNTPYVTILAHYYKGEKGYNENSSQTSDKDIESITKWWIDFTSKHMTF